MEPILECRNLYKSYRGKPALRGLNLSVYAGRIVGLLGPNGSGKTTLIKLACGLLTPTSGQVLIKGRAPDATTKALVSYLPDRNYLENWMTVQQALTFFEEFYQDFDPARAADMLSRLNIRPDMRFGSLSKGTKEKVQLILVMSRRASLYLLDEPIGGVDPAARDYILSTIINNYDRGATVLISTHLIADVEKVLDDVVFIRQGLVELCATVQEIREEKGCSVDELFREVYKC